ncbi:MAG TPA: 2Fe-2S iron-sulfur cluster-binding protein [Steroidobacteraceae bacterium]|nr:2Fe-2S iron-sulfur cluster-binding protein [Steroidobacteraceae bacterium]
MPKVTLGSGASFEARPGVTILDAAISAGITLPYSCRTGRCGTCKCRVVAGTTTAQFAETGLEAGDLEQGWILGCAREAQTDLLVEVEDLGGVSLPPARTLPCRISSIDNPARDVARIRLRLPPASEFRFLPGQHIEVIGHGGLRRSYSLASAGPADQGLELHVRAVEGGAMSALWFGQARINDLLRLQGPRGTFFLRDVADRNLIFLATGTGIAPVKAMLEALVMLAPGTGPASVTLLWGGRVLTDLYLDIGRMAAIHRYIPVLSRADATWEGARGHVQDVLLGERPDLGNAVVYACGSDAMIHDARRALARAGLPQRRFHSDAFVCSAKP